VLHIKSLRLNLAFEDYVSSDYEMGLVTVTLILQNVVCVTNAEIVEISLQV